MYAIIKRSLDLILSASLLILLSPLYAVIALAVWSSLGSPVFFRQERPGLNGISFQLVKFRTMLEAVDDHGNSLPDAQRLTAFGKWLRASSLDEIPELWNVLRGDMSLVGPRPLLMQYLPLYTVQQARRHEVRPGLTGLAQVSGRNALTWEEKFELDVSYVDHHSFTLDMKIILKTVFHVLKRDGISSDGNATMPPFTGDREK